MSLAEGAGLLGTTVVAFSPLLFGGSPYKSRTVGKRVPSLFRVAGEPSLTWPRKVKETIATISVKDLKL